MRIEVLEDKVIIDFKEKKNEPVLFTNSSIDEVIAQKDGIILEQGNTIKNLEKSVDSLIAESNKKSKEIASLKYNSGTITLNDDGIL